MWGKWITGVTDRLPQINHELLGNFHNNQIKHLIGDMESLFKHNVNIINARMGWGDTTPLEYLGYEELSPQQRVDTLLAKGRDRYQRHYSINKSNRNSLAFNFRHEGMVHSMTVDLPYMTNHAIMLEGTPYYPNFVITDRGGLSYGRDNIILQVMRAKLIFTRHNKNSSCSVTTIEGEHISELLIVAKINQSPKARKVPPPIVLHHLAKLGFTKTMELYEVGNALTLISEKAYMKNPVKKGYLHVRIGDPENIPANEEDDCEYAYIRIHKERMESSMVIKRVLISMVDIFNAYPYFRYKEIENAIFYTMVTGRICDFERDPYKVHFIANAEDYMRMNETLLDEEYRKQHASIGIKYNNLDELMLYMFHNIDRLMSEHSNNRIDMYKKRIGSAALIKNKLFEEFNRRVFAFINPRSDTSKPPAVKTLFKRIDFRKAINGTKIFRMSPTLYNSSLLPLIISRFTTLTSTDIHPNRKAGRGGGGGVVPADLLVMHPSYLSTISILTYPSSKPVISGSINGFVQVDKQGNILTPQRIKEFATVYIKEQ